MESILVVDDDCADIDALKRTFNKARILNPVQTVNLASDAIAYLAGDGLYADRTAYPFPGIIFVDLIMPFKSGLDVVRWIHSHSAAALQTLAIVATTGIGNISQIREAYLHGAHSFLIKPFVEEDFLNLLHGHVGIHIEERDEGRALHFDRAYFRRKV